MHEFDVAIIGGGPAGRVTVHTLHRGDPTLKVAVFKDEQINVNRCAVPYGIDGAKSLQKYQIPNTLVTDFGAELIVGRVDHIDLEERRLTLHDGRLFGFKQLVFATGARPLSPPIEGVDSSRVLPVRSLKDLDNLRQYASEPRLNKAVVVGGGYIGVEAGVELQKMGFAVTIVEMLPTILSQTTEPEFVEYLTAVLRDEGLELKTETAVTGFKDQDDALEVALGDGTLLTCDFAVMAAGVRLNTELAEAAGLEVSPFGIVIDEHLQTRVKGVYAAGDCAAKISMVTGQPTRGEFGTNAVFMGKVVGANILGEEARFPGVLNANVTKVFAWGVGSAGVTQNMADSAGMACVTGHASVPDRYPMMDGVEKVRAKLVFAPDTGRLLGGSVMRHGDCVAGDVGFLSLAIQMGVTWDDLLEFQYATHPELAAKPSDNHFVFAAKDAREKVSRAANP